MSTYTLEPEEDPRFGRRYRVGAVVEVNVGSFADTDENRWRRATIINAELSPAAIGRGYDWDDDYYAVKFFGTEPDDPYWWESDGTPCTWRPHTLRLPGERYPDWGH